jgi:class 3 adenylate cyclase
MEPRIQYAQTKDGVSIAFYTLGEGVPLVLMGSPPFSHFQQLWQRWPGARQGLERLAAERMLISFDWRGSGLSERSVTEYSVDALILDLEAVVERLGLEKLALLGWVDSGPVAIAYATRHPEQVSHLVLYFTYARGSDYLQAPEIPGLLALMDKDWRLFTETVANAALGWPAGEEARQTAEFLRESTTPEVVRAAWPASLEFDVTALLPEVRSATLVLHRRDARSITTDMARELASRIPNARLNVLEGASASPFQEDVLAAIDEFLGEGEEAETRSAGLSADIVHTILFTDVEGSTALTQRLGDAKARELLRAHERMVREALKAHGGSELKTTGDGFMASFSSATRALESAIAMQRAFAAHNESAEEPILVRVGMNAGEPIAEDEDLFGTAVIEAARIAAAAKGGEILVSDVVRQLAKGKDFLFADRGEVALKGFDEPVRLYEVRWQD